ncbi:MAG: sulfotransferase domain-containing protein [Fulvivirga sp.]|uniref:sulfotransferase domain-containing protein n=1 Tax=Fulvivirga sp. TaxID=1931237 RepID=UPI0032EFE665
MKQTLKTLLPELIINKIRKRKRRPIYQELVKNLPDNVIVSYPKCGRTWLRLIINHAFYFEYPELFGGNPKEYIDTLLRLNEKSKTFPKLQMTHDGRPMYYHYRELFRDKKLYKEKKVLFLVREPKDTLISWYFHLTQRGTSLKKKEFDLTSIENFIMGHYGGLKTIIRFYNDWIKAKNQCKDFKIVKYEDMRNHPIDSVKEILSFFNVKDISLSSIAKSVEFNDFSKMKQKEKENFYGTNAIGVSSDKQDNNDAYKVRKGKVGGYKDYLSDSTIDSIDKIIKNSLNHEVGY